LGRSKQGARNRQTLPHAARKSSHHVTGAMRKAHGFEGGTGASGGIGQRKELREKDQIFLGGEIVVHKCVVGDHPNAPLYGVAGQFRSARRERKFAFGGPCEERRDL
jgi:hypothetical protein